MLEFLLTLALGDPFYDPIYEDAERLGVVLNEFPQICDDLQAHKQLSKGRKNARELFAL